MKELKQQIKWSSTKLEKEKDNSYPAQDTSFRQLIIHYIGDLFTWSKLETGNKVHLKI